MLVPSASSQTHRKFRDDGFVVVPRVIDESELACIREDAEALVAKQRIIWERDRGRSWNSIPGEGKEGVWSASPQPRVVVPGLAMAPEIRSMGALALHPKLTQATRDIFLGAQLMAVTTLEIICNAQENHGPQLWHRDFDPRLGPSLPAIQRNIRVNGYGFVQWNIALYDDDVLWVVPGSHLRPNSSIENDYVNSKVRSAIPGSIPIRLRAGDAIGFSDLCLHWASNYSTNLRRTLFFAYRAFDSSSFPHSIVAHTYYWDSRLPQVMQGSMRSEYFRMLQCQLSWYGMIEAAFRAAIEADVEGFKQEVARLHPASTGQDVCLIWLYEFAKKVFILSRPDVQRMPPSERAVMAREHPSGLYLQGIQQLAQRFRLGEAAALRSRFRMLDQMLKDPQMIEHGSESQVATWRQYVGIDPGEKAVLGFLNTWPTAS